MNNQVEEFVRQNITNQNINSGSKIRKIIMPAERSVDIDSELDWKIAEFILEKKSLRHKK